MNLRKKQKIKSHWEDQRLLGTSVGGTLVLSQVGNAVICSHCHNTVPQTGWLNNRNFFLSVLEARSPRSRCQHGQVVVRVLFWLADCWLLTASSHAGRGELSLWGLSYKGSASRPNHLPKTLVFTTITSGRYVFNIWILRVGGDGHKYSDHRRAHKFS